MCVCMYVCVHVSACVCVHMCVCDKGSEQTLWTQAVSGFLPNSSHRSLLSCAWGLGEETLLFL